jgi:hypothetical protein
MSETMASVTITVESGGREILAWIASMAITKTLVGDARKQLINVGVVRWSQVWHKVTGICKPRKAAFNHRRVPGQEERTTILESGSAASNLACAVELKSGVLLVD